MNGSSVSSVVRPSLVESLVIRIAERVIQKLDSAGGKKNVNDCNVPVIPRLSSNSLNGSKWERRKKEIKLEITSTTTEMSTLT